MGHQRHITSDQIGKIVEQASDMTGYPDLQLSILTRALISAAKAHGVSCSAVVRELEAAWISQPGARIVARTPILRSG